jgi:hypothetical protein
VLGRREARALDEVDHRGGDALELLAGLARGGQVAAARAAALAAFHERKVQRPPGQADHRHPDQLLLEEELQERNAAVEDALQHQDVHPALVVGRHQVPAARVQTFQALHVPVGLAGGAQAAIQALLTATQAVASAVRI